MIGKRNIFVFFLPCCIFFLASCGPFHIAKKRYSDGFYVDYSKTEKAKDKGKKELIESEKTAADSTTTEQIATESIPDTLVNTVPDSIPIEKTELTFSAPADSVNAVDTIVKRQTTEIAPLVENISEYIGEEDATELENFILFILCIVAPPIAVYVKFDDNKKLRTVIILTLLGWIPGVFYAFFQISGDD